MVVKLDKLRDFETVYHVPGARYKQGNQYFNCGGFPIVDGKPVGLPEPPPLRRQIKLNLTSRPGKTSAEAAADAQRMIEERDGIVHKCDVKGCGGGPFKTSAALKRHMTMTHPGIN